MKKNSNSKYLQIWRPFNIISNQFSKNLSDHFHNILIKEFIHKKKNFIILWIRKRYKSIFISQKFCKTIYKKSNLKQNFLYDYGNSNSLTVNKILDIFQKSFNKKIKYKFNSVKKNVNIISRNREINFINTKENSYKLLKVYYDTYLKFNENKFL